MNYQSVSWNAVCEKARAVWSVYEHISDEEHKKQFDKNMGEFMAIIQKIHGFVPEPDNNTARRG